MGRGCSTATIGALTDELVVPYIPSAQADMADVLGLGTTDAERASFVREEVATYQRLVA